MKECTTHHNACACREAKYTSDMALLRAELKRTAAQLEHWRALAHSRAGLEAQYGRMRQVLELIAAPKRKDGTYNRDRKACEALAKAVLNRQDDCPTREEIDLATIEAMRARNDCEHGTPKGQLCQLCTTAYFSSKDGIK